MKKIILLVALIFISGCSYQKLADTNIVSEQNNNDKLAEFAFDAPDTEDNAIHSWTKTRVEESLAGHKSLIKIPVIRNFGWGCVPASNYCLGLFSGGSCVYVKFTGDNKTIKEYEDKCDKANGPEEVKKFCYITFGLEGYFTGKADEICADHTEMEANGGSCCTEKDTEYEFFVSKSQPNINKENSDFIFKVFK